ncbi:MAG: SusC/RagA family TonB-linked outer membrane protein, partial [Sphingobacteriaceae bacterium]
MKQKLLSTLLLCLLFIGVSFAQDRVVSGQVTAQDDGSPIANVTVRVQGESSGTQTGQNGNFSIDLGNGNVLIFTAIGYGEKRVNVGSLATVDVVLESQETSLDEVIVVAYGTVKKEDFAGSAVTLSSKDLDKRPLSNPLSALQGSGPGVQTAAPGGAPGSSPTIRIRGIGSYSSSNEPLIVVDGIEFNGGMANINPDDIENISVLKDAATTTMFGSRGANGVVMITTKRGSEGKAGIDFKAQFGTNSNVLPAYNTVDAGEYYQLSWQALKNSYQYGNGIPNDIASMLASGQYGRNASGDQVYNGETYQDLVEFLGNYNAFNVPNSELIGLDGALNPNAQLKYADDLNWLDQSSRTGRRNEYGITYNTGFKKSDIYTSLNFLDEQGWALRSDRKTYRARVNANTQITDWLKGGLNFTGTHYSGNSANSGSGIVNPFYFSRSIAPIYPVYVHDATTGEYMYDEFGNRIFDYGNLSAEYGLSRPFNSGRHAIAENLWNQDKTSGDLLSARTYFDVDIFPWLTFTTNLSADVRNTTAMSYENTIVGDGAPSGRMYRDAYRTYNHLFNQLLRANHAFGDHNIEAVAGHEYNYYKYSGIWGRRQGEGFEDFYVFSNFTDITGLAEDFSEKTLESYFLRTNYDYQSKYYFSGSLRYDGDSKIPAHNRWGMFWSLGGAWRMDQEDFMKDLGWVNMLKLRASYGALGNNAFLDADGDPVYYPYQMGYAIMNNGAYSGSVLNSIGSADLRWEVQKPFDVGIDFGFLENRITGTLEYYNKLGTDLLYEVNQPYHNGGTTDGSYAIYKNVGNMRNSGFELSLTGNIIRREDFNWNLTLNASTLKNKITKMPEETPEIVSSPYKRAVGHSNYDYYTRNYYGVDPDNGMAMYLGLENGVTVDPTADDFHENFKIIGNDTLTYNQNYAKQDWIGKSALPTVFGSIVNHLSYKDFDFS